MYTYSKFKVFDYIFNCSQLFNIILKGWLIMISLF